MSRVEIEYCVPCGLLQPALRIEAELLETVGQDVDEVALTTGDGGILAVRVEDETVYHNRRDGPEVDLGELVSAIESRLDSAA